MEPYPRFLPVGDAALTVEFGDAIDPAINAAVVALDMCLAASDVDGIIETVPSYRSLLIRYDPAEIGFDPLVAALRPLIGQDVWSDGPGGRRWIVPVSYDAPFATDLPEVAERFGMAAEQVIAAHTEPDYKVYTVGFAPGMPLMGGLPAPLHIPRRQSPRPGVPAGAVIIGGMQAAIVPVVTLSGWYILGQTPVRPFDPRRGNPFLFRHGDTVRFRSINTAEYHRMAALPWDELFSLIEATP
jgi:KipI family sensor histidine kinase inhibitor